MPYLNLDLDYFTHPKTMRLTGLLGPQAVCMPIRLWCYVGKYHCATGMLEAYSKQEIESAIGWTGNSGELVDAMVKISLLEAVPLGYRVHDWKEHAGHLSAFKKRAKTAAKVRWRKYASSTAKSRITTTPILPGSSSPGLAKPIEEERVVWVLDEWAKIPGVKPVMKLGTMLKRRISSRLKEQREESWWMEFFGRVQQSDFLCGRAREFSASLDWVLSPKNLEKIEMGNYDNRTAATRPPAPPPKTDPIARGQWKNLYGDPKVHGYV